MAKSKKRRKAEQKVSAPATAFAYSGNIKVSLQKGNKTYFKKTYTNHGRWPLFYFLNSCLAGNYTHADTFRPKLINIFDFHQTGQTVPQIIDDSSLETQQIGHWFNKENCLSLISYPYMSQPDVNFVVDQNGTSKVTYKFTVPFTQINLQSDKAIEGFALYAAQTSTNSTDPSSLDNLANPCAYFFLTDGNGVQAKVKNLLSDIPTASLTDDYNLYIEWTLSIVNQEKLSN